MTPNAATACEISNRLLRQTGDALLSGDFERFQACFTLPFEVDTCRGRNTITTAEELGATFRKVCQHYRMLNVTDLVRHCDEAKFGGPRTIAAKHTSRLLSGSFLVREAMSAYSVLRWSDAGWRIQSTRYALRDDVGFSSALIGRVIKMPELTLQNH